MIRILIAFIVAATAAFAERPAPAKKTASKPAAKPAAKPIAVKAAVKKPARSVSTSRAAVSKTPVRKPAPRQAVSASKPPARRSTVATSRKPSSRNRRYRPSRFYKSPLFADSTEGDNIDGEDLTVRRAAVTALGPLNGAVVVTDAETGRVLTMVNQKLALRGGFVPCSTVKVITSLAALSEGECERTQAIRLGRRSSMDLTDALARSNNPYFAILGKRLGFDRVRQYAQLYGMGEKAGLNIKGEEPGVLADAPPPGGVGMMTSFGEGISMTPLQLSALMGAIANGGTLYYLQYPRSDEEAQNFVPTVKRKLEIGPFIEEIKYGMRGAVEYGTARRASLVSTESLFGKTGTCTDFKTSYHMGWFGAYNSDGRKLVVVVMLTGDKKANGPLAAGVAGNVYRHLSSENYLAQAPAPTPASVIAAPAFLSQ